MMSKKTIAFIVFYISIIFLMLFTYFYVQKYYSHEVTHKLTEMIPAEGYILRQASKNQTLSTVDAFSHD